MGVRISSAIGFFVWDVTGSGGIKRLLWLLRVITIVS